MVNDFDIWNGEIANSFSGGSGTMESPYIINSCKEFAYFVDTVNTSGNNQMYKNICFLLTKNLDFNNILLDPVGKNGYSRFAGIFNGGGHIIKNYNYSGTTDDKGIFDYIESPAEIYNLGVIATDILNPNSAACPVSPLISVATTQYGKVEIHDCFTIANVIEGFSVGGIVGATNYSSNVTIKNCYSRINTIRLKCNHPSNTQDAGGIIGVFRGNGTCTVENCYVVNQSIEVENNDTNTSAVKNIGRIIGRANNFLLKNNYSTNSAARAVGTSPDAESAILTEDEIKNIAGILGDSYIGSVDGINDGFPILIWQFTLPIIEVPDISIVKTVNGSKQLLSLRDQKIKKDGVLHSFGVGSGIKHNGDLYVLGSEEEGMLHIRLRGSEISLELSLYNSIMVDWGDGMTSSVDDLNPSIYHSYTDGLSEHDILFYWKGDGVSYLYCPISGITLLDITKCYKLGYLFCNGNNITTLDLSNCQFLSHLLCNGNNITTLDLSGNTLIEMVQANYGILNSLIITEENIKLKTIGVIGTPLSLDRVALSSLAESLPYRYDESGTLYLQNSTSAAWIQDICAAKNWTIQ